MVSQAIKPRILSDRCRLTYAEKAKPPAVGLSLTGALMTQQALCQHWPLAPDQRDPEIGWSATAGRWQANRQRTISSRAAPAFLLPVGLLRLVPFDISSLRQCSP